MLSYRHSFHAGNHADVLKHVVLTLIINALKEKDKPFIYLDTHSGAGRYVLDSQASTKTEEFREGIERIWQQKDNAPALLSDYISVIRSYNNLDNLKFYPGSPLIAKQLLRPQDELFLSELHPADYPLLKKEFQKDERASVLRTDGFHQIKAKLPPASRRGLVLIDPAYEIKDDYQTVVSAIQEGYKRFATGTYALWYPVVRRQQIRKMVQALKDTGIRRILQIELAVKPDNEQRGMTASGMIVVNPPWKLESQMKTLLPWLHRTLVPQKTGNTLLTWITPE